MKAGSGHLTLHLLGFITQEQFYCSEWCLLDSEFFLCETISVKFGLEKLYTFSNIQSSNCTYAIYSGFLRCYGNSYLRYWARIIQNYISYIHSIFFFTIKFLLFTVSLQQILSHGGGGVVLLSICSSPLGIFDFCSWKPLFLYLYFLMGRFGLMFCPKVISWAMFAPCISSCSRLTDQ